MLMCTLFVGMESEKVYVLYTRENIDILGWPPNMQTNYLRHNITETIHDVNKHLSFISKYEVYILSIQVFAKYAKKCIYSKLDQHM